MKFAVYTLRRTSSRTVYAIYDDEKSRPVTANDGAPLTFTDREAAQKKAASLEEVSAEEDS